MTDFSDIMYCFNCSNYDHEKESCIVKDPKETIKPLQTCSFFQEQTSYTKEEIKKKLRERSRSGTVMSKFIFDPEQVLQVKPFPACKINNDLFAYGLMLPKEQDVTDKAGNFIRTRQVFSPVLVTSRAEILEVKSYEVKEKNIRFRSIPGELSLRWSLPNIEKYLHEKQEPIDGLRLHTGISNPVSYTHLRAHET